LLAWRDMKIRYKQTILDAAWGFLNLPGSDRELVTTPLAETSNCVLSVPHTET
jgi:hypothetical protein